MLADEGYGFWGFGINPETHSFLTLSNQQLSRSKMIGATEAALEILTNNNVRSSSHAEIQEMSLAEDESGENPTDVVIGDA